MQNCDLKLAPGDALRQHFPMFDHSAEKPLHYLDSAASSLKPRVVVERLAHYLSHEHANIHRGAYALSANATELYDGVRDTVSRFINAPSSRCIVFTKGTTEGVNLIAHALEGQFKAGDSILLTLLEHHSNIVPWQLMKARRGVALHFVNIKDDASLDYDDLSSRLKAVRPKLLSITAISNSFGTRIDLARVIKLAHSYGTLVCVDAAQAVHHTEVDVRALDVDLLVFSGHKMYGPTGVGVLYAKPEILEVMEPYQGGGDMIQSVTVEGSTWADYPSRFEAGTPPIAEVVALGSAIDFINAIGLQQISKHERQLHAEARELLSCEPGVTVYGNAEQCSILPFNVAGIHPHDLSTIVDSKANVQIRAGHHCAMPALKRLGLQSTARASIGVYSTISDFAALIEGIRHAKRILC